MRPGSRLPRRGVLETVDLADAAGRQAGGYSLGMRQRLSLAGAAARRPAGADPRRAGERARPAGHSLASRAAPLARAEGRTIFLSSHVLGEIEQIADEVVIIHRGKFVEHAATAELAARSAGGIRVRSPQVDRLRAVLEEAGIKVGSVEGDSAVASDTTTAQVGEVAAANGIVLHELVAEVSTLEEAFLELAT